MLFTSSTKVGKGSGCYDVFKGVKGCSLSGVIKCHFASVHIQNHSYNFRFLSHVEWLPWCGTCFMLSVAISYSPESLCWCQHVLALSVDGLTGYSYNPVGVAIYLHLPAMASSRIALGSKHLSTNVKALWVVWKLENLSRVLHHCEIFREDKAASCCIGIQNHWSLMKKKKKLFIFRNILNVLTPYSWHLPYWVIFFILSHTLYFREPRCLATSIKAPGIIFGSRGRCQVLKGYYCQFLSVIFTGRQTWSTILPSNCFLVILKEKKR